MVQTKASVGSSASFETAGTPFVGNTTANKTYDFKFVVKKIIIQSTGAGTGNTVSFDGGTNKVILVQNKVYEFNIKTNKIVVECAAGNVNFLAEVTSVEGGQVSPIVQSSYEYIYGCTDSTASNFDANANEDDGSCTYSYTLGADPTALFHFDGNTTESCSSIVTATAANAIAYSTGKFTNAFDFNGTSTTLTFDATGVVLGTTPCANNPLCLDGAYTIDLWIKLNSVNRSLDFGGGPFNTNTTGVCGARPYGSGVSGKKEHFELMYVDPAVAPMVGAPSAHYMILATFGRPSGDGYMGILPSDPTGDWHHMAVTRDSSFVVRLFWDGVALEMLEFSNPSSNIGTSYTELTGNDTNGYPNRTSVLNSLVWGGDVNAISTRFNGELDEFRITKGTAIDFTSNVPIQAYTCS